MSEESKDGGGFGSNCSEMSSAATMAMATVRRAIGREREQMGLAPVQMEREMACACFVADRRGVHAV